MLVPGRKLWWSSSLPHPQHPAQPLGVQAGSPRVRSKIKSIGIHLLLQLGSQGSLRKLLTAFDMWVFSLAVALQMASSEVQLSSFTSAVSFHINILPCILW